MGAKKNPRPKPRVLKHETWRELENQAAIEPTGTAAS